MPRSGAACRNVRLRDILHMGVESLADVPLSGFDVRLTCVTQVTEGLVVDAVACGPPPRCPERNSQASRVHSSYERGLAGLPVNGRSRFRGSGRSSVNDQARGGIQERSAAGHTVHGGRIDR